MMSCHPVCLRNLVRSEALYMFLYSHTNEYVRVLNMLECGISRKTLYLIKQNTRCLQINLWQIKCGTNPSFYYVQSDRNAQLNWCF